MLNQRNCFKHLLMNLVLAAAVLAPVMAQAGGRPSAKAAKEEAVKVKEMQRLDDVGRHLRMAQVLLDSADNALAMREAQEVLKLDKGNIEARRILAATFVRAKDYPKALETLDSLDKDVPHDLWIATLRADIFNLMGDKPKALAALEALCQLPNAPAMAHFKAAKLLDEQRTAPGAEATIAPRPRAHAAAYLQTPDAFNSSEGKEAERMVMEIDHGEVGRVFFAARENYYAAFRTGGSISSNYIRAAEEGMKKALTLAPKLQDAHAFLGMCYSSVKSRNYDLVAAERELRQAPDLADGLFFLGRIYRETDRLAEAVTVFEKAVKLQPKHA